MMIPIKESFSDQKSYCQRLQMMQLKASLFLVLLFMSLTEILCFFGNKFFQFWFRNKLCIFLNKNSWCYMNIANLFSYRNTFYSHWTKISFYKYWIGNTIFLVHILWEIHNIKCAFFLRGVYVVFSSGTFHKIFTLSDWRKVWLWLEFFWGS